MSIETLLKEKCRELNSRLFDEQEIFENEFEQDSEDFEYGANILEDLEFEDIQFDLEVDDGNIYFILDSIRNTKIREVVKSFDRVRAERRFDIFKPQVVQHIGKRNYCYLEKILSKNDYKVEEFSASFFTDCVRKIDYEKGVFNYSNWIPDNGGEYYFSTPIFPFNLQIEGILTSKHMFKILENFKKELKAKKVVLSRLYLSEDTPDKEITNFLIDKWDNSFVTTDSSIDIFNIYEKREIVQRTMTMNYYGEDSTCSLSYITRPQFLGKGYLEKLLRKDKIIK